MDDATQDFVRALLAEGPQHHRRLRNFGKLVGAWHVEGRRFDEETGQWQPRDFRYLVAWVFEGRAIQDLEVVTDPDGTEHTIAMGLRVADPHAGIARVSYFSPVTNQYANLVASTWRTGVRQDGSQNDGRPIRWNFTHIGEHDYTWEGWVSDDEGATWRLVEELAGTRLA
ncbi:hypothetical protein [Gryllotalpicola ginsengisoli]|uniref:hypothetical protein n=1 Tax=Gryllotalpicola ginsengisoli TaxID=444608 RepID=UPI0003B5991D|nr:hypothetical protein [Gryllotalpicola ginsengisoli]